MKKLLLICTAALALLGLSVAPARAADALPVAVTFELDKADLSADAVKSIATAAEQAKSAADSRILVSGFTDMSGSAAHNDELAKKRAVAVRDALVSAGLAAERIVLVKPSARMKDGDPAKARSVELSLLAAGAAGPPADTLLVIETVAVAAAPAAPAAAPTPNKGDVAWMLTSTALVLLMSVPALALFYGGLVRSKNMLSVLMQVFVTFSLVVVLWFIYGYSLAFTEGNAFFGGLGRLFMSGAVDAGKGEFAMAATFSKGVVIPELLFAAFQATFAAITCCLLLGALVERVKFSAVLLFTVIWFTFAYAPIAHMVWFWPGPDAYTKPEVVDTLNATAGLIWQWGALDFAGGTVVHINAGVAGLVGAYLIGKRVGYGKEAMPPHSLTMTMIGASLLWFGWFGFNAGSALEANNTAVLAFINTFLATACAVLAWSFARVDAEGQALDAGCRFRCGGWSGRHHAGGGQRRHPRRVRHRYCRGTGLPVGCHGPQEAAGRRRCAGRVWHPRRGRHPGCAADGCVQCARIGRTGLRHRLGDRGHRLQQHRRAGVGPAKGGACHRGLDRSRVAGRVQDRRHGRRAACSAGRGARRPGYDVSRRVRVPHVVEVVPGGQLPGTRRAS